ncbi:MAG: pyroglutamyl-peptidase I [Planctomycetes bacterium]|nr:pyroglutamyl-peptidase I [Planctomycetota bacterium]
MTLPAGPRILTAFEPFGGRWSNLSALVLARWEEAGVEKALLPVEIAGLAARIAKLFESRPAALVLMGESWSGKKIAVERVALNILDAGERPDNSGFAPSERRVLPGAPLALEATWDADGAVEWIRARGLSAEKSYHAGAYVCNQALYLALALSRELAPGAAIGFLHLPARKPWGASRRALAMARRLSGLVGAVVRREPAGESRRALEAAG